MAAYRELAAFAQFSQDLDPTTKAQLDRGSRITEVLKQGWDKPFMVEVQVVIIFGVTKGYFDKCRLEKIKDVQDRLVTLFTKTHKKLLDKIRTEKIISAEMEKQMAKIVADFIDDLPDEYKNN
jgi:F-type H+-transporting ATPase subunit alpha